MSPSKPLQKSSSARRFCNSEEPFPWRVLLAGILVGAGGSFQMGYLLTVLNPTEPIFRQFINETTYGNYGRHMSETVYRFVWSVILNILIVGSMFGTLPLVRLSESIGRRYSFYASSGLVCTGAVLQTISRMCSSFEVFSFGRFACGLGCGLALGLEPLYLNEISPIRLRGFFGGMTAVFFESGFVFGGVVTLPDVFGTEANWPWIFALQCAPVVVLWAALPFLHESPRYLAARGRFAEAVESLAFFGHTDPAAALIEIQTEIRCQTQTVTWREMCKKRHLRKGAYLGSLVAVAASVSGIAAVDFFSTQILKEVGLSHADAHYASVAIFFQAALATIFSSFILDKCGRRALLLTTTFLLIIINILLMIFTLVYERYEFTWAGYLSVAACIAFTIAFGVGPSVLQWMVAPELVPQNARSAAQSVAMTLQKISFIIIAVAFYPLQGAVGAYCFVLFIAPLTVFFVLFIMQFPETKLRTPLEIMIELGYDKDADTEKNATAISATLQADIA